MQKNFDTYSGLKNYDEQLDLVPHFEVFPEMKPWIGPRYDLEKAKILIIGESHYFAKGATFHHEPSTWYTRNFSEDMSKRHGHRIRYLISKRADVKVHVNYTRIDAQLKKTDYFQLEKASSTSTLDSIAYINYFQRPANTTGGSLKITVQDAEVAKKTIKDVIDIIKPDLVLFSSVKAFKCAKRYNLFSEISPLVDYSPHPCSAWWRRETKSSGKFPDCNLGKISGSDRFLTACNNMAKAIQH
jgi:hypothetical protein